MSFDFTPAFRAKTGLDAAGENAINIAAPRPGEMLDAVNQEYFIRNNTVQPHDPNRGYDQGFVVSYADRLYSAKATIGAKPWDANDWTKLRTDPVWRDMSPQTVTQAFAGDYIHLNTSVARFNAQLPATPKVGEMVVFHDRTGHAHLRPVEIERNGQTIDGKQENYMMNIPFSTVYFYYTASNTWIYSLQYQPRMKILENGSATEGSPYKLATGEIVYGRTSGGKFWFVLPAYPNDNDRVVLADLDGKNSISYSQVSIDPAAAGDQIEDARGQLHTSIESNLSGEVHLIYNKATKVWRTYITDLRGRVVRVNVPTFQSEPFQVLYITHEFEDLIVVLLPKRPAHGNWVDLVNTLSTPTSRVIVRLHADSIAAGTTILGDVNSVLKRKYKDIPKVISEEPVGTEFEFPIGDHGVDMRIHYDGDSDQWITGSVQYRIDRADETNPSRPGLIPIAIQSEVNKQNYAPDGQVDVVQPDTAVTPATLDKRRSTEALAGLARIATASELQLPTDGIHRNDVIVTPQRLNERQATETIRGVAEVATQTETRSETNDTHLITPKKFHAAQAEEGLSGVARLVQAGGNKRTSRIGNGTGVFDATNHLRIVTPKMLDEYRATENQPGSLWVATAGEIRINDSTVDDAIITPKKFAAWKASATIRGIAARATAAEAQATSGTGERWDNVFITPETLNARTPTESRRGVVEIATQGEVDLGTDDIRFISPLKFATWQGYDHFVTDGDTDGLRHTGNLWDSVTLAIDLSSETQRGTMRVATQVEANEQIAPLDNVALTPKKLNDRRASVSLYGISRLATDAEIDAGAVGKAAGSPVAVTPVDLLRWTRTSPNSRSTTTRYGTARDALTSETWVGNPTQGSTQAVNDYLQDGINVTPRGLNFALANYLPRLGKAADSDKLDNLDSTQFARRDIDQTINGSYTFNGKNVILGGAGVLAIAKDGDNDSAAILSYALGANPTLTIDTPAPWQFDVTDTLGVVKLGIKSDGFIVVDKGATFGAAITENEATANGASPGTGTLRQKYLGINNNAASASKWQTARTITFTGDVDGTTSLDGSANVIASLQVKDNSHNHAAENITTGTLDSARTQQASHTTRGTVQLTADRTGQSQTLAASQKALYDIDQILQTATQNKGVYDYITFREWIQIGSVRMSANSEGILEFTYGHPIQA
ncbi:tail fiber protein proximal subunit [Vibrio phage EniLVp02]